MRVSAIGTILLDCIFLAILLAAPPPVAAQSGTIDLDNPNVNLGSRHLADAAGKTAVVTAGGTRFVILRWDFGALAGKKVVGSGLLELTTRALERTSDEIPDFGEIRAVEISGGDPRWDKKTIAFNSLCEGRPPGLVLNPQMIIDWPVSEGDDAKTCLTIPKPVLQRLIDGQTLGIAIRPLGAINAAFYREDGSGGIKRAPRILVNIRD